MKRFRLLNPDDIEVKIKQCSAKGAVALLYKTARTDMAILDETFGAENWECDYTEIKDNLYCNIRVWDEEKKQWISKQDCGVESREDSEGNQKKGEASDAFKRAGFKWGIGRELYTAPFTFLKVDTVEKNGKYELADKFARYEVSHINYVDNRITELVIISNKGEEVFRMGCKAQPKHTLVCSVCGEQIRGVSKGAEIKSAQEVNELTGGKCINCFKKGNA